MKLIALAIFALAGDVMRIAEGVVKNARRRVTREQVRKMKQDQIDRYKEAFSKRHG